ncbi:MAG: hypothetical protein HF976_10420 [ANME-2 cluster archaeon]|nr:hypothetical protein [ANME-2 cluster archaeon]MBC2701804.1 hypothetical protein [ANME-2 cluster archaeon]MBC2706581.1 hypothetical protein [ANME-2 cluster archaeon]MBC2748337.1 hypothetical protein [ANME-2 cluster archaeon]MBC2763368.1 hypothetical protein [ANME-2 cluster archaeon]
MPRPAAGPLAGAAVAITVPYAMHPRDWGDVIGSSAVAISGSIAIKQINESAGDAFNLTGLG